MTKPENLARINFDAMLNASKWRVQARNELNLGNQFKMVGAIWFPGTWAYLITGTTKTRRIPCAPTAKTALVIIVCGRVQSGGCQKC